MNHLRHCLVLFAGAALAVVGSAQAAGKLGVSDAWIRLAPPGASMVAGYATLTNSGDAPVIVLTVQSDAFRMASLHETIIDKGVHVPPHTEIGYDPEADARRFTVTDGIVIIPKGYSFDDKK